MIDLVALDALRAVGAHGSVVAAADALGFTPSAVSQQVKRLEKQTGRAAARAGRPGRDADQARQAPRRAGHAAARDLEELQAGLHQQAGTVAGHVRLTAFSTAMRGLIAPALPRRPRRHPHLRVTLAEPSRGTRSAWSRPGRPTSASRTAGATCRCRCPTTSPAPPWPATSPR